MTGHPPLAFTPDVARGDWIRDRLGDWSRIASVTPQGFEAYARVLHPIDAQLLEWDGDTPITLESARLRWRDIAERCGTTWHPLMQRSGIIGTHKDPRMHETGWQYGEPAQGRMPIDELSVISGILAGHTMTPDACIAGLWEGYGWIQGGHAVARFVAAPDGASRFTRARLRRQARRPEPTGFAAEVMRGPRLELPGRTYLLFEGDIRALQESDWAKRSWGEPGAFWNQTPNQLWPDDHAWFVASEIDFDSTIIGGSRALIDELTACSAIEAVETPPDASLAHDADRIN